MFPFPLYFVLKSFCFALFLPSSDDFIERVVEQYIYISRFRF